VYYLQDYFDVFVRAIVTVWGQNLKKMDTDETAEAWRVVFAFIIDRLKDGYHAECSDRRT